MDVILFVAWDTAGEEYGIPLSVVADESDKIILDFIQLECMFGRCLVLPYCLVVSPEARKLAVRFIK